MPRIPEKAQALGDIGAAIEVAAYAYLLASDEVEEEETEELEEIEKEHIQDLLAVRDINATHPYLSHDVGAGRREIGILEAYIQYINTLRLHFLRNFACIEHPFGSLLKYAHKLAEGDIGIIGLLNLDAVQNPSITRLQ